MLLITRRLGEGIVINGAMTIQILDIKGGRVKLGFEYPQGHTVYRAEVFEKIKAENQAAAQAPGQVDAGRLGSALKLGTGDANSGHATTNESLNHAKPATADDE